MNIASDRARSYCGCIALLWATAELAGPKAALADQDIDDNPAGGLQVEAHLRHRVVIPAILYFRVGSPTFGAIDRVTFDVRAGAGLPTGNNTTKADSSMPLGSSIPVDATGNGDLVVDIRSNIGTVNISYSVSDPSGLVGGNGSYLPFDQIETIASDPALPAPALSNTGAAPGSAGSVDVAGNLYGGRVVDRQGVWSYRYRNQTTPLAGTYDGRVTYTASAP